MSGPHEGNGPHEGSDFHEGNGPHKGVGLRGVDLMKGVGLTRINSWFIFYKQLMIWPVDCLHNNENCAYHFHQGLPFPTMLI